MPESKARTAQVQSPEGWKNASVSQLKPGDRFRLIKPDGSAVCNLCGATEFTAGRAVEQLQPVAAELRARVRERFDQFFSSARPAACA